MIHRVGQLLIRVSSVFHRAEQNPLMSKLGLRTRNLPLYHQALRHTSVAKQSIGQEGDSYERLEFLGDAVLDCAVADYLYRAFSHEDEGFLTALRAKLVSKPALAQVARSIELGSAIQLTSELERYGGRDSDSILSDSLEALIGAIYLDKGMPTARAFVFKHMLKDVDLNALAAKESNFKSRLQEYAQANDLELPRYKLLATAGPASRRTFTIEVELNGHAQGIGHGTSKKKAEQRAARAALRAMQSNAP